MSPPNLLPMNRALSAETITDQAEPYTQLRATVTREAPPLAFSR
jgi:hypothetical protein